MRPTHQNNGALYIINERRMSVLAALAPPQVLPNSSGSLAIFAAIRRA